jgi:hypothetical protein
MDTGVLPGASRRRPPQLDQENIRISAALDHIRNHGNLDGFPASRGERIALVTTAAKHGLLEWNRSRGRYELTSRGHRQVRAMHRTSRNALRGQGGTFRMGMNAVVSVAATIMVGGAVFLAFHPDTPPKSPASQQTAGHFADHTSGSAKSQEILASPAAQVRSATLPAVAITDQEQRAIDTAPTTAAPEGADLGRAEQTPTVPIAAARAIEANPAPKQLGAARDPEQLKSAHHQKKRSARGRSWDGHRRGSGYAYAPYPSPWGYRSVPAWWSR